MSGQHRPDRPLTDGHWDDTVTLAAQGFVRGLFTSLERALMLAARNAISHRAALDAAYDEQRRMLTVASHHALGQAGNIIERTGGATR